MSEQNTTQSELGLFLRAYLRAFISGNTELVKKFLYIFKRRIETYETAIISDYFGKTLRQKV